MDATSRLSRFVEVMERKYPDKTEDSFYSVVFGGPDAVECRVSDIKELLSEASDDLESMVELGNSALQHLERAKKAEAACAEMRALLTECVGNEVMCLVREGCTDPTCCREGRVRDLLSKNTIGAEFISPKEARKLKEDMIKLYCGVNNEE